ncbi:MAG TPA: aspartate aminotransferase family protein, partial [Atribacterota bacterium]|nr:aspartate aminotransferase family protein [Atribacterota bacterium]
MDIKQKYDKYVNLYFINKMEDVVIDHAEGSTVYATDGKEYIDCFAGIAVNNAGHRNPKVIQAAKDQMDKLVHCCAYVYYSEPPAILAEKLAQITPGKLDKTFFSNSGAEAIEGALRVAKQFTGNYEIIALQCSFHGRTNATLSVTGNRKRKFKGGPFLPGIAFAPAPYCYRCPFELKRESCNLKCARYLRDVIDFQTSGSVAAFIAEPVMGEGGIIVPPEDYFKEIKKVLDEFNILLITDEVQSGFGRTGKLFAIEHYGVEPDIMTMAKGIADGFPLGAFITRDEIASSFKPGDHLSTFGGNPVSCAAAIANIDFLVDEKIPEKALEKGNRFMQNVKDKLMKKYDLIGDVRGKGLMIGVELIKDKEKTPASAEAGKVRNLCREKGLLIGVGGVLGNVLRIQPPLVIEERQLTKSLIYWMMPFQSLKSN